MYFPYSFKIALNVQIRHSQGTLPIVSFKNYANFTPAIRTCGFRQNVNIYFGRCSPRFDLLIYAELFTDKEQLWRQFFQPRTVQDSRSSTCFLLPLQSLLNNDNLRLEADWKFDCDGSSKVEVSKRFLFYVQWISNNEREVQIMF